MSQKYNYIDHKFDRFIHFYMHNLLQMNALLLVAQANSFFLEKSFPMAILPEWMFGNVILVITPLIGYILIAKEERAAAASRSTYYFRSRKSE